MSVGGSAEPTGEATTGHGPGSTDAAGLTSQGQLYRHVRALISAKVIEQHGRGSYRIPASKLVPTLIIMTAAADIAEVLR